MGRLKLKGKEKPKETPDFGLMAAFQMANYQWNVKKQAIKELTVNKEVLAHAEKYKFDVEDEFTDWLYGAFALALHRRHKFGAKRIARLFNDMQEIKNDLIADGVDHKQIWDMVRDEVRLDITVD